MSDGEVTVNAVIRDHFRHCALPSYCDAAGGRRADPAGEPAALERLVARRASSSPQGRDTRATATDEVGIMEAVVTADSPLIGSTSARLGLRAHHQVNLVALSRSGEQLTQRLHAVTFRSGDVIALQGDLNVLPDTLGELRLLPLAARGMSLGRAATLLPLAVLAAAMALVALQPGAGGDRLLRRLGPAAAVSRAQPAGGLRGGRVADPDPAGRPDPGQRGRPHHRRHRPDRGLARRSRPAPAADRVRWR